MNLGEIRAQFIKDSGLYDLVKANGDDNGANFVLNSGQRLLNLIVRTPKIEGWFYKNLTAGDVSAEIQYLKSVKEVWLVTDESRTLLTPKTEQWIRENFSYPSSSVDYAVPLYYAPIKIGLAPSLRAETAVTFAAAGIRDYSHIKFGNHFAYKGIMIVPQPDQAYTLQILADFADFEMTTDTDVTFWTVNYPEALILASMAAREGVHRNSSGWSDLMRSLQPYVDGIDNENASEELASSVEFQSSWDESDWEI